MASGFLCNRYPWLPWCRVDPIPPTPPPHHDPMIRAVRVVLSNIGNLTPEATLTLDGGTSKVTGTLLPGNTMDFVIPTPEWPAPFGVVFNATCPGFKPFSVHFALAQFSDIPSPPDNPNLHVQTTAFIDDPNVQKPLVFSMEQKVVLLPLHSDGEFFRTSDNQPWSQYGVTDFRLLQMELQGENTDAIIDDRKGLGFNLHRILMMADMMFKLSPGTPGYWDAFRRLRDKLRNKGQRAEWVVFADATRVIPALSTQQAYARQVNVEVVGNFDLLELVNENDQTVNSIAALAFPRFSNLCSRGSNGADAPPVGCSFITDGNGQVIGMRVDVTPWDYVPQHPSRPADWPRRVGHNTMEWADEAHVVGMTNETCRPDQGGGPVVSDFFDAAVNAALLCGGATFHSDGGKFSRIFSGPDRACAEGWMRGARVVGLDYRLGRYVGNQSHEMPIEWREGDSSRAHARLLGNRAAVSLPQMRQGYVPRGINGWSITKRVDSYVELSK